MAVSPESMHASAPSRIAFATSVVSARVGRLECCMLSNICVATITGFWYCWQTRIICFCTIGILATSISTPRSPRATITTSAPSMMDSRFSSASRFSILATTRAEDCRVRSNSLRRLTSTEDRTKERLTKSAPSEAAHSACFQSSALIAATDRSTPGKFTP